MSLFSTLDQRREEFTTRRERLTVWMASVGGAILVVTGVVLVTLYL